MTVFVATRMLLENDGDVTVLKVCETRLMALGVVTADMGNGGSMRDLDEPFSDRADEWSAHGGLIVWKLSQSTLELEQDDD